jgi:hypothetical protein
VAELLGWQRHAPEPGNGLFAKLASPRNDARFAEDDRPWLRAMALVIARRRPRALRLQAAERRLM